MRIAFSAPLKSPDHPVPSGDRLMARLLLQALRLAGHEVELVSDLRCFAKNADDFTARNEAHPQADKIIDRWNGNYPDLWFSYHPYYKAPDYILHRVLQFVDLPVYTAEATLSSKRQTGEWAEKQILVEQLVERARANFCFTDRDIAGLKHLSPRCNAVRLLPFIDTGLFKTRSGGNDVVKLVATGMMRGGVKYQSYEILAQSLAIIEKTDWQLQIIGDGKDRAQVEQLFNRFDPARIEWCGQLLPENVGSILAGNDVFVWPGIGEAYGMAYLEAQACGLPIIAFDTHGVPSVVEHGRGGLLVEAGNVKAYAQAVRRVIMDKNLRDRLGMAATDFVHNERDIHNGAETINTTIRATL